jgi:hypothetical protein
LIADDSPKRTSALPPSYAPDVLIIGLGHVGLPLAAEAGRGDLTVVGHDLDEAVVNDLNAGRSRIALVSGMAIRCHEVGDINGRLPRYAAAKATVLLNRHKKPVKGSRVLLLGVTYKRDITMAGERVLCAPTTRHPRPGTRVRPHGSSRQALTSMREISYQTRREAFMYGKISLATGAIGAGALLAGGMHMMTWLIAGGFAVVLGGLMLYRLATIKARR